MKSSYAQIVLPSCAKSKGVEVQIFTIRKK